MPRFSVIIPVYNRADLISETIESVLKQSYSDFEVVLVDDCSTDKSYEIIQHHANKDARIRTFKFDENQGRCAARNKGLDLAQGEWICYLDSDDQYYSNHLQTITDLIQAYPEQPAFATDQHINGILKEYKNKSLHGDLRKLTINDFIENNPLTANQLCHSNKLMVRWSDQRIPISEDWLFMRELSIKTSVLKKAIVTNNLRDHDQRSMNTTQVEKFVEFNLLAAELFITKNELPASIKSRVKAYTRILCVNVLLGSGNKKQAWSLFIKSLRYMRIYFYSLFYKAIIKFIIR